MTRDFVSRFINRPWVGTAIMAVILFNAAILGLETSDAAIAVAGPVIKTLDTICLVIFVLELLAKLYAQGLRFFRDGWNVFDFLIIAISLVPAGEGLTILRALRILRLLRVVSVAPALRRVVEGFVTALPGMASVFLLMGIIFYIASVMATSLFGDTFPQWFGTLGKSAYSLFQIMTLESWSMGIVRPVMDQHPAAWAFFVPFILVTTFAVVNLVVGLIVNSMQDAHAVEANQATDAYREEVMARLAAIERTLSPPND
jgi:voltage-gated sodium channel